MSAAVRNSFGKTLPFSEQLTNRIHTHNFISFSEKQNCSIPTCQIHPQKSFYHPRTYSDQSHPVYCQ